MRTGKRVDREWSARRSGEHLEGNARGGRWREIVVPQAASRDVPCLPHSKGSESVRARCPPPFRRHPAQARIRQISAETTTKITEKHPLDGDAANRSGDESRSSASNFSTASLDSFKPSPVRGDRRETVFKDDADRRWFLNTLAEAGEDQREMSNILDSQADPQADPVLRASGRPARSSRRRTSPPPRPGAAQRAENRAQCVEEIRRIFEP